LLVMNWKECGRGRLRHNLRMRKTTKHISEDNRSSSLYMNQWPHKYM
jgi:hypothetical protein